MIKAIRGTRDLLPPDTDLWNRVEAKVRDVFARYNFHEIRTPDLRRHATVLAQRRRRHRHRHQGDVHLGRQAPAPPARKSQSLTLRPENTAGVVRAYIEHGLDKRGTLQKLYYIGPQFRRERPQKGRYRQFYQIGAEIIGPPSAGSESPARDAEVLEMLATLLDELGLRGWTLQLNSVGCAADRARYNQALREALQAGRRTRCAPTASAAPRPIRCACSTARSPKTSPSSRSCRKISQYLDDACRENFAAVRAMLDAVGVPYTINERMVRGLDYYTRTTFEFTHGDLGAQSAVLGGGRYDGLSESLDGPKAPGIGFAIGEDRLILALQAEGVTADAEARRLHRSAGRGHESRTR